MAAPIKNNPFSADEHLLHFAEFTKAVEYAGGTTPHMLMAVEFSKHQDSLEEKLWWAGCYAFVYNIPTAEIINKSWVPGEWKRQDLVDWARANWGGLKFRKERKAARSPERLADCMDSYYRFSLEIPNRDWFLPGSMLGEVRYQLAFDDLCRSVKYMGRYIAIRWVEVIRRVFDIDGLEMPDLRPRDGDHPRKALALIYPEAMDALMGGNSDGEIAVTNSVVDECLADLWDLYGVRTDYYTMQSLLCEYKQSCLGKRQYPGKSVDSTLTYFEKVYDYWGPEKAAESEIYKVRKDIFPPYMLGEIQGWTGVREELGNVLIDYGYTWSDYVYDYVATVDLSRPVLRAESVRSIL